MPTIPSPRDWGTFNLEPFHEYRARWPDEHSHIPDTVIETWVHRHWREFQAWLPLRPLEWRYEVKEFTSTEVLNVGHIGDWLKTLDHWGDDLFDGAMRKETWLGKFMLENGTTPSPMIIAREAGGWRHPREHGAYMQQPLQLIEGHMRLAYLRALVRRSHVSLKPVHQVVLATLPAVTPRDA